MVLNHCILNHPLILHEGEQAYGSNIFCYGCERHILGPSYNCDQCEFFLHKSCAEQPNQITHHLHPDHSLDFHHLRYHLRNLPETGRCSACRQELKNFTYICPSRSCNFQVDAICACMEHSIQERVKQKCHEHPLMSLQKPTLFLCDACGKEHKDVSFLCTTCGFWVSQECASLPRFIESGDHHHSLTLVHSHQSGYSKLLPHCKVCNEEVNLSYWVYCCDKCRYFCHVGCAKFHRYRTEREPEIPEDKPISLPVPYGVDLTACFILKAISLQTTNNVNNTSSMQKSRSMIIHDSHIDHPLKLFENEIHDQSSNGKGKIGNICNACIRPVLPPFYGCTPCNFFLHVWCAEFPKYPDMPCHPEHTLEPIFELTKKTSDVNLPPCEGCQAEFNGFMFVCVKCYCFFHIKCCSLPGAITHAGHNHALALRRKTNHAQCTACDCTFLGLTFICEDCDFILDTRCALLPGTVRHRWDKHPFALTYSPVEGTDEYICELCEGDIDPKLWFYHCIQCDQSLHTKCIIPVNDMQSSSLGPNY